MRRSPFRFVFTALAPALVAAVAVAQGADNCSSPQAISGSGPFAYDTTAATTDGFEEGVLGAPGLRQIDRDVWYTWTAPATAAYEVSTCTGVGTGATAIAIYEYGCSTTAGRAINMRGFNCGVFTELTFGAKVGTSYLIRIGVPNTGAGNTGMFTITDVPLPTSMGSAVNPANGRTYHFLEPSSWTVAQTAALNLGGDLVTVNDQAEQDWLQATFHNFGGQARSFWIGLNDAENEGVFEWVSGETASYTNWSGPAPNNQNEYEHYAHFRHDWADGSWNDLIGDPDTGFFYSAVHSVVEIADAGNYCVAAVNDTGSPAIMSTMGSASIAANDLVLRCGPVGTNQPGIFFFSDTPAANPMGLPFGEGRRCVIGAVTRFLPPVFESGGFIDRPVDYNNLPGGASIMSGDTLYFQGWYRDTLDNNGDMTASGFNLSDGLELTFQP